MKADIGWGVVELVVHDVEDDVDKFQFNVNKFRWKRVRVTLEVLPDPKVKNDMPVCYAAAGIA